MRNDAAQSGSVSRDGGGRARSRLSRGSGVAALGLLPYLLYMLCFLVVPIGLIAWSAFRHDVNGTTTFTLQNTIDSLHGAYLTGLLNSIQLAAVVAVAASVLGLLLAWAVLSTGSSLLNKAVSTSSAVLANFGGLPLAFLFTAVLGTTGGVLTIALKDWFGLSLRDDLHFNLYSLTGVELVYLYFLIPLMVLVISPALEGIKPQWKEASESLGASTGEYWRLVAMPVLLPQILGAVMLLFCSAFSAFATASALTNGTLGITPLQIDTAVSGNVLVGQENIGAALALNMIIVVLPLTLMYQFLQRRTSRWLQ